MKVRHQEYNMPGNEIIGMQYLGLTISGDLE